jgi:hypothetical protein
MTREELLAVIEKAKRSGQTTLDFAWKGIEELPSEIGQLRLWLLHPLFR